MNTWVWILLGLIYILSPYDLIPDFIPVRGWIDDLVVLILIVRHFVRTGRRPATERPQDRHQHQEGGESAHEYTQQPGSPYDVLGLPPHASQDEIRSAYRKLAGQYHPDKVAHLGKEFQDMAEKRFKEIQNAYDSLVKP
jgi:uncharacterized membrane protein YkvA (DUF1232 family)